MELLVEELDLFGLGTLEGDDSVRLLEDGVEEREAAEGNGKESQDGEGGGYEGIDLDDLVEECFIPEDE